MSSALLWAIAWPRHWGEPPFPVQLGSISTTRAQAIDYVRARVVVPALRPTWRSLYRQGYRAVRVRVEVVT